MWNFCPSSLFLATSFNSLSNRTALSCPPVAVPEREAGHQLQPEAEGEVPAPPAGQTYRSPPASTQEHLPPEKRAEDYERGSPQEVRVCYPFLYFSCLYLDVELSVSMSR